jgi:predicted RNase H-like nuclease
MSKRLQVLLDEAELRDIQRLARAQRMTVAEWVRRALRAARRREPLREAGKKLDVVRAAAGHSFPTADIDAMLGEIEGGYLGKPPRR